MGKARSFSDSTNDTIYQTEINSENYSMGQQNAYNLGSVHFTDQSGIGNFSQAGSDQRKASLSGALFLGNLGFDVKTAELDVGTFTIDLNNDNTGTVLSVIPVDRIVTLSAGITSDLTTITGAQRPGQRLRLYNTNGNTITIKNTASTVNAILTPNGGDFAFSNNMVIDLVFDAELSPSQWRVVTGVSGGSGGSGGEFFGPWTADHDAGNFALNNIAALQITDSVGGVHGLLQGLAATGIRLTLTAGEQFNIFDNITNIFQMDSTTGLQLLTNDLTMGTGGNIVAGGANEGVTNTGHIDFVDNTSTPVASISLFSDGTDLFANTGGGTVNLSDIGTASQTPWLSDIDAADFALNDVSSIQISDTSSNIHGLLQGLIGTGIRLTLTAGEQFNIFDNVTNIFQMDSTTGLQIFGNDLTIGTGGNIVAGAAGEGVTNIGHLDFIDNLATPASPLSIYSDGTDMLVNTGGGVVNLSDVADGIFLDSTFRILGSGDQTKQLAFEVDTNVPTSTTVTMTIPSASGTIFINPAQEDLDLNTFDVFDIDKLAFMNFASTGSSLNIGFSALGNGGVRANVLNNGDFEITEENVLHFSFDGGTNTINVFDSGFIIQETVSNDQFSITQSITTTTLNATDQMDFQIGGTKQFEITDGLITFDGAKGILANVDQIGFRNLGNLIEDDSGGLIFITIPGDSFNWADGTNIFAILDIDGLFLNDMFIQLDSISPQPTTTGLDVGKIFMDGTNSNHLSIVRDTTVVDLEAGGGSLDGVQDFEIPLGDLDIDGDVQEIYISNGKQGYDVAAISAFNEDIVHWFPIYVAQRARVNKLGWNNLSTTTGTITFAMGLYDNIGGGVNYPNDLIVQDNSSLVTAAVQAATTNSLTPTNIEAGLYWVAVVITNLQIGSIASCSAHSLSGANSAGWFDDAGNTDVFLPIFGFVDASATLPGTAPSAMAAISSLPQAVFARFIANTS